MGEHDKRTESDGPHQDIQIMDFETHDDYDNFVKINDIAMIYLERDAEFTGEFNNNQPLSDVLSIDDLNVVFFSLLDRVRPICLPIEEPLVSRDFNGYNPFVIGWGRTGNHHQTC